MALSPSRRRALRLTLPAIGAAAALALSACSSGGGSTASSAEPTDFSGVKLTVWNNIDYDPYQTLQKGYFATCAKQLGITVDNQTITGDYASKLLQAASSRTLPDVALLDSAVEIPQLASEGVLADLGAHGVTTEGQSKAVASLGTYDGKLVALPVQVEDYALFYDKAAFKKAGIDAPPTTFEELVADAKRLTTSTQKGIALSGSDDGAAPVYFLPWLLSAGGNAGEPTGAGAVTAVDLYKQLVADGSLSKEFVNWGWDSPDQWKSGKAAITVTGPWELVDSSLKVDYGTAPFPTATAGGEAKVGLLGYGYGVAANKDRTKEAAAAALVQCRASEANQLETAVKGGYIPALTSAQASFVQQVPAAKSFVDALPTAYNYAALGTRWNDLQKQYVSALQYATVDGDSAKEALERATQS
ncbi:extracellular solute-binding protein [uncultured Amnibacterium sp.]|uniref:extracellular solute-binding protein n=1 Tax=uncultured Amnibacterium sp. TaxID=1631851 RepID=UPI0035CA4139